MPSIPVQRLTLLLLLSLLIAPPVSGQEAAGSVTEQPILSLEEIGYETTHFSVMDGLPILHVTSLAQTPDGYLWIGSTDGLARFDGNRFEVIRREQVPELIDFEILNM